MYSIDLNCDLGESYGTYRLGHDEQLLKLVSSANIACGFHAGDPGVMRETVRLCLENGVSIGAHPGLPDLQGFGRRELAMSPSEIHDAVLYQLGALSAFVHAEGGRLSHVKLHGALYHMAARDRNAAFSMASAVWKFQPDLMLFGPRGSELEHAAAHESLIFVGEAFADRRYREDGTLVPRSLESSLIQDEREAAGQAVRMAIHGEVGSENGKTINLEAETICIHGDGGKAVQFAEAIRRELLESGVRIEAPQR